MERRSIRRGGILSAGYDRAARILQVEFDSRRVFEASGVGEETARRFFRSSSPFGYWKDAIEEHFTVREVSARSGDPGGARRRLEALFGG